MGEQAGEVVDTKGDRSPGRIRPKKPGFLLELSALSGGFA